MDGSGPLGSGPSSYALRRKRSASAPAEPPRNVPPFRAGSLGAEDDRFRTGRGWTGAGVAETGTCGLKQERAWLKQGVRGTKAYGWLGAGSGDQGVEEPRVVPYLRVPQHTDRKPALRVLNRFDDSVVSVCGHLELSWVGDALVMR